MYNIEDRDRAVREVKKQLFAVSQKTYPQIPRTTIDGKYDDETRAAVKEFQKIKGLNESGEIDLITFNALYADYVAAMDEFYGRDYIVGDGGFPLNIGDMSEDVRVLHVIINELAKAYGDLERVGTGSYYSRRTGRAVRHLRRLFMMEDSEALDRALFQRMLTELDAIRRADKKIEV